MHEVRKGLWAFFLDCAFQVLIGWPGKLQSRSCITDFAVAVLFIHVFVIPLFDSKVSFEDYFVSI